MKKQMLTFTAFTMSLLISCNNSDKGTADTSKDTVVVTNEKTNTVTKYKTVEVAPVVQTKFIDKYPKAADVQWVKYTDMPPLDIDWELANWPKLDSMDYAANYTIDSTDYWSWYTPEGDWIATVSPVKNNQVPDAVDLVLRNSYANYNITSVHKENDKNRTAYEIKMENGEDKMKLLIDENGNIMKKKGKEDGVKMKEKNKY